MSSTQSPTSAAFPSVRTPYLRTVAIVALVLIMAGSGFLIAGLGTSMAAPAVSAPRSVASMATPVLSGASLQKSSVYTQPGTPMQTLQNATVLEPLTPQSPIAFSVGFNLQNPQQLDQIVQEQSSPGSPMFHQWLTLAQERTMFGPDPVTYQDTINYFTSLGLKVETEGLLSISFTGTTSEVNAAFHTQLSNVQYDNGKVAAMNTLPLGLPAPIAGSIASVNGLDGAMQAHVQSFVDPTAIADFGNSPTTLPDGATTASPLAIPLTASTQGNLSEIFNFSNSGFFWFEHFSKRLKAYVQDQVITPGALSTLYNATQLLNQGINGDSTGSPITIAIIMAGGINPTDIEGWGQLAWNNPMQVMNRLVPTPIDGAFTTNGTFSWLDGASSEMALDIEFSSTMAPAAKIMPVYGPCLCTNVLDDDYATLENMGKVPNIISNSWGGSEDAWGNLYGPNWANALTMHQYFGLLTARGATVLASSGDGGGFDTFTGQLSGSFPATDPYVLSVNGLRTVATDYSGRAFPTATTYGIENITIPEFPQTPVLINYPVHVDMASKVFSQSYWYEPYSNYTLTGAPPQGSGGFDTSYWFNQSWMEHGYTVPDLGRSLGSGVSAEADYNQSIFFDGSMQFFWGGTSFACPTTAGMFALIEDYLQKNGHNPYLGDGNGPVFEVANAYLNGNLTLKPFYDIVSKAGVSANGTSYWGNFGVANGYEFPTGQKFAYTAQGQTTYGDTLPGWDFPTGWGSIIVNNFAEDLNTVESWPGTFWTVNSAGSSYDSGAWEYMTLNQTYHIEVNTTTAFSATSPNVTVVFHGLDGTNTSLQEPLTLVTSPASPPGLAEEFTLNTGIAPFSQPGWVAFEYGDKAQPSAGFAYDWISYPVPAGTLSVAVVEPTSSSVLSGYAQFNPWPLGYSAPTSLDPNCCTANPNTFTVHVTFNGAPVYNALVTASVPSTAVLAWEGSRAQQATQSQGNPHETTTTMLSWTYTNLNGDALVYTWNLVQPTTYNIQAQYGSAKANTTYNLTPGINVKTTDVGGGKYSNFNTISFILKDLRQTDTPATEDLWAPNSVQQTDFYNLVYAWRGEILPLSTNDWSGAPVSGVTTWIGNWDLGGENKYNIYQATQGVVGVTNVSGTQNVTGPTGNTTIFVPDNMTGIPWFQYPDGSLASLAYLAASDPGQSNRTFSYTEPCVPQLADTQATTITCQFNDSYQRNYTAAPVLLLPDPVNATTQTTAGVARTFFGVGANVSVKVNVQLPTNDPFVNGYGYNWLPGTEHVVSVEAYVDNVPRANLTPAAVPQWQNFTISGNLTGSYASGIHQLTIIATDSEGHVFTVTHPFVVASISLTNLNISSTYTVLPYNLTWSYSPPGNPFPSAEMNNHTFSQSLEIQYEAAGCGATNDPCPIVVNYSERIRDGVTSYNQSLNATLLNLQHFYAGASELPPGQYIVTIWLNANHSGSIASSVGTYFVPNPLSASINGPTDWSTVPVGNVTISYSYAGDYVQNATLAVYPANVANASAVFSIGAFVPGVGASGRGGAASWTAVAPGEYEIVLALGAPYGHYTATSFVNVTLASGTVWLNQTHPTSLLGSVAPATSATVLALIAAIVGLVLGMMIAPTMRSSGPRPSGGAAGAKPMAAWSEDSQKSASGKSVCPICHEQFETDFALHQHQKITHGIEE